MLGSSVGGLWKEVNICKKEINHDELESYNSLVLIDMSTHVYDNLVNSSCVFSVHHRMFSICDQVWLSKLFFVPPKVSLISFSSAEAT